MGLVVTLALATLSGCAGAGDARPERYAGPAGDPLSISRNPATIVPPRPSNRASVAPPTSAARAAAAELGPDVAARMPPPTHPPAVVRRPLDPGAEALVAAIAAAMPDRHVPGADRAAGGTIVALRRIRNHSRSGRDEFTAFLDRFAALLTDAAEGDRIRFTAGEERADYVLSGTCYLMTASGFDQWELYLSLSRAGEGRDWPLWQSKNPVHVLRQPRPGASQIMPTSGDR